MKIKNNHNLPEVIVSMLSVKKQKYADITVTELLKTPRQRQLALRHDDEIEQDISENFWAWFGTALHYPLELHAKKFDALPEEKMYLEVNDWKVGGRPDLLLNENGNLKLIDLKTMSVFGYLLEKKEAKPDHEKQLNIYRYLFIKHGFRPDYLEVWALFKDWRRSEARDPEYPQIPFVRIKIPIWPDEQAKAFIEERVRIHQEAEKTDDAKLPMCTPEERWARPTTWAVQKKGATKAYRVFQSPEDAVGFARGTEYVVQERHGIDVKCESFCSAAMFCDHWRELQRRQP